MLADPKPLASHAPPERRGAIVLLGLTEPTASAWRQVADSVAIRTLPGAGISDCRSEALGSSPTAIVASAWPKIDAQLLNAANPVFRRAAVVVVAPDAGEADFWRNLAWDALAADSGASAIRTALTAALVEADRRRKAWDLVEEYHRRYDSLSGDELQVLRAVCDGQLNKQIAASLGVSIRTVEQRRRRVFTKMGVDSAVPLADRVATVRTLETHRLRRHAPSDSPKPNFNTGPLGSLSKMPGTMASR